jgi:GNAT superfamily N-acetyltransferase
MELTIRLAEQNDLPQLLDLYPHLDAVNIPFSTDVAEQRLTALHAYNGSAIFIGLIDGRIVCSCTLIVIPNLTHGGTPYSLIENVVTHPSCRSQGHGKAILRAAVDAAWDAGCYKVMLMTGSKKPSTLAFYEAAGFEQSKTGFQIRRIPPRPE